MRIERNPCPNDWLTYVREQVNSIITRRGTEALLNIRKELELAQEAEAVGVPPPGGRSSAELQQLLTDGRTALKNLYDTITSATTVADINTAIQNLHDQGLTWIVGDDLKPSFPETCPWQDSSSV